MSPIFIKHFQKNAAGPRAAIAPLLKHLSPTIQTMGGGAAGYALTDIEAKQMNLSPVGREALLYTNLGLGLIGGNPVLRNRLTKSWQALDPTNHRTKSLALDTGKLIRTGSGLGAKTIGFAIGDKIYRSSDSIANAGDSLTSAGKRIEGAAGKVEDAAANIEGTTSAIQGAAEGVEKFTDQTQKDMGVVTDNLAVSSGGLKDISSNVNDMLVDAKQDQGGFRETLQEGVDAIRPISDFFRPENINNTTKNLGLAAAGAGALWGGYSLLRDYLNYNRIKKEREAKMQAARPKLAAFPWGKAMTGLGSVLGGGFAYNNAKNTGLSDSESILPVAVGTISGGLAGRGLANARVGNSTYAKAMVPVSTTLANDMYGAPVWAMMKGKIHEQKADAATRPFSNAALGVGGGALTVAALAALYQGARAAKQVAEGQPLVDAKTTNTVLTGSGGPDNPNFGGKMLVTLPTRNPGDRETTIELPLENMPLSSTLINKIRRDTKRRLRTESDTRTLREEDRSPERMKQLMAVN